MLSKEEILERSRKENKDEGSDSVFKKGLEKGYILFCLFYIFFIFMDLFYGNGIVSKAVNVMFWGFWMTTSFSKYRFSKSKLELLTGICAGLIVVLNLIMYLKKVVG